MEFMVLLKEPGMVTDLQALTDNPDPNVVKRTIRVFTNVYRHALSLLAQGQLDPLQSKARYEEIKNASDHLVEMLQSALNEGVVVHLIRFLEAALLTHAASADDGSCSSNLVLLTTMKNTGLAALIKFVSSPQVEGAAFCVAVKALINVACVQADVRPQVIDVIESLMKTPPDNLFDHILRSFQNTLKRNLIKFLRITKCQIEKDRTLQLMVDIGVDRKKLSQWVPRLSGKRLRPFYRSGFASFLKKRKLSRQIIHGFSHSGSRILPPKSVVLKVKSSSSSKLCPRNISGTKVPTVFDGCVGAAGRNVIIDTDALKKSIPKMQLDLTKLQGKTDATKPCSVPMVEERPQVTEISSTTSDCSAEHGNTPDGSHHRSQNLFSFTKGPSVIPNLDDCQNSAKLNHEMKETKAKANIASGIHIRKASSHSEDNFTERCSPKEKEVYEKLNEAFVVDLIISSLRYVPDEKPAYFPQLYLESLNIMKEKMSILLARYIPDDLFYTSSRRSGTIPADLNYHSLYNTYIERIFWKPEVRKVPEAIAPPLLSCRLPPIHQPPLFNRPPPPISTNSLTSSRFAGGASSVSCNSSNSFQNFYDTDVTSVNNVYTTEYNPVGPSPQLANHSIFSQTSCQPQAPYYSAADSARSSAPCHNWDIGPLPQYNEAAARGDYFESTQGPSYCGSQTSASFKNGRYRPRRWDSAQGEYHASNAAVTNCCGGATSDWSQCYNGGFGANQQATNYNYGSYSSSTAPGGSNGPPPPNHFDDGSCGPPQRPYCNDGSCGPPQYPYRVDGPCGPPQHPSYDGFSGPSQHPYHDDGSCSPPQRPYNDDGSCGPPRYPYRDDGPYNDCYGGPQHAPYYSGGSSFSPVAPFYNGGSCGPPVNPSYEGSSCDPPVAPFYENTPGGLPSAPNFDCGSCSHDMAPPNRGSCVQYNSLPEQSRHSNFEPARFRSDGGHYKRHYQKRLQNWRREY